jgi:zinc/manganese transport system substrate-binding protein
MQKWTKIAIAAIAVVAIASAGTYEVLTSTVSNPCAGTTLQAPAANSPLPLITPGINPNVTAGSSGLSEGSTGSAHVAAGSTIQVVAGENFWGSLISQLGGNRTSVISIVDDPNTDPHEYEANASDAEEVSSAQFVIVNGVGYDDWALQLIAAAASSNQVVLNVGDLNGVNVNGGIVTGNPHQWYNPYYVIRTVAAMYMDLVAVQPSSASYFQANYAALNTSLDRLYAQANWIRENRAGTVVTSTESIFVYLANYTNLDLVSPPPFMEAIAEGNDPTTQSVVTFQCQLQSGKVAILVYNEQTVTPITSNMKSIAAQHNVTVVGVTETIQPPDVSFQNWMGGEYDYLANALNATVLGE